MVQYSSLRLGTRTFYEIHPRTKTAYDPAL